MAQYWARVATASQDTAWCEVCDEAKHVVFRLMPTAEPGGEADARPLCGGCSEGLVDGAVVTELDLQQRRQRRRGSQEP